MTDKIITTGQVDKWFTDYTDTLKDQIVMTTLNQKQEREDLYNLYQAAQILKAHFYSEFMSDTITFNQPTYD